MIGGALRANDAVYTLLGQWVDGTRPRGDVTVLYLAAHTREEAGVHLHVDVLGTDA